MDKLHLFRNTKPTKVETWELTSDEIESGIKKSPNKEKSRTRQLYWWILPDIEKELTPIFFKFLQRVEEERKHPNLYYEKSTTLVFI